MKILASIRPATAGAIALCATLPQPAAAQNVIALCADEIATHCAQVEPGHGRLYACLYANEASLGERCDMATADVLDQLDRFFELVRHAKQECREDIKALCEDVVVGEGRLYSCLKSQEGRLTQGCGDAMTAISSE